MSHPDHGATLAQTKKGSATKNEIVATEAQWRKALSWYVMYHYGIQEPKYIQRLVSNLVPDAVAKREMQRTQAQQRQAARMSKLRRASRS